ncbi:MAG: HYR domain-containing protein [Actinomycetota bacterium]
MNLKTRRAAWAPLFLTFLLASPAEAVAPVVYANSFNDLNGVYSVRGGQPGLSGGALRLQGTMTATVCNPFCLPQTVTTETAAVVAAGSKFADGTRYDVDVRFDAPSVQGMHGGMLLSSTGQYRYGSGNAVTFDYLQSGGRYRLTRYLNGTEYAGPIVSAPTPSGWHRWTLVVRGTKVAAAVDGTHMATMQLPTSPGAMALGFWTWHNGVVSFDDVAVRQYQAPTVASVPDITAEATSASGATVSFSKPTAEDGAGTPLTVTCDAESGAEFPIGSTVVECSAVDLVNETTTSSFTIDVVDTTAPVIDEHPDLTVPGTGPDGAIVEYEAPATNDIVDGEGVASCLPASGSLFPIGDTTVTCSAVDAAGNIATPTTFGVRVEEVITLDLEGFDERNVVPDGLGYSASISLAYLDGSPAEGAAVSVTLTRQTLSESMTFEGSSGSDGRFTFDVPALFALPGEYAVEASAVLRAASASDSMTFTVGIV